MVHSGLTKGEIQLLSDGSETRQFIHVDDSSELIMRWCEDGIPLRSFDATSFIWVSIAQVAGIVADILKVPVKLGLPVHDIQVIKNEPREDILKYWHPSTSLYSGIEKVITYQKSLL
jgi:nucleoside-diphosphate-sugar epimerase